jgi:hypothetical protein
MTDAQEKRLIEALRKVDAHGDVAPAHVQDSMKRRTSPERLALSNFDRLVFASLYWIAPRVVNALNGKAGDGYPLASRWFSFVLAMEVAMSRPRPKVPLPGFERDARHDLMCAALLERLGNSKGKISGAAHIAISGTPASVSSR